MIWGLFALLRDLRRFQYQTRSVLGKLAEEVNRSLGGDVLGMHRAEARGYIRGKTTPVVQAAHAELKLLFPRLPQATLDRFALEASDQILKQVLEDVLRGKMQSYSQRRAA